jgi:dTDP-4-dehydrorhamnose reductase
MRILITGGLGQLGLALQEMLDEHELTIVDLPETDITNREEIDLAIRRSQAELVIHCAAYTNVDDCARNPDLAYRVNAVGTLNVAQTCRQVGAELVHISTNEVFSGTRVEGYVEWMPVDPINAYGRSKAVAESFVKNHLDRYYIVRTAWLYAAGGNNFIHAILDRARSEGAVRVVADEIGNPTYAADLANAISRLIPTGNYGTYHFTNSGDCSRWAFAGEILRLAGLETVKNTPILGREYRRASTPPAFAALHNVAGASIGISLRKWQDALREYMETHELLGDQT